MIKDQKIELCLKDIRNLCGKVRMLDTLPERDRAGKYRKAIADLFSELRERVHEYLMYAAFGGLMVTEAAGETLMRTWFRSDEFRALVNGAWGCARRGQYDDFYKAACKIRESSVLLVTCHGGYEEDIE